MVLKYEEAKLNYTRARNRLNRFCRLTQMSYNDIRKSDLKPQTWFAFEKRGKHLKGATRRLFEHLEQSRRKLPAKRKPVGAPPRNPILQEELKSDNQKIANIEDHPQYITLLQALKASNEKNSQIESENLVLTQSLKDHEGTKTELKQIQVKLDLLNSDLNELSEVSKKQQELLAVKNHSLRISNSKLEEATLLNHNAEIKFKRLRSDYSFLEREKTLEIISLKDKIVRQQTSHDEAHHAIAVRNEKISSLGEEVSRLRVLVLEAQKRVKEASSLNKAEDPRKEDNPLAEEKSNVKLFVKRSARRLKDVDWRTLLNLKFRKIEGPNSMKKTAFNDIIDVVQRYVVYSNDAVGEGLLGNYFSEQIHYIVEQAIQPSSSKV